MVTPPTTARVLAASARGKTVTTVAERRCKGRKERLKRFTQRARARRDQQLGTYALLVPVTEHRVMTAPGHKAQAVPARQAEQVLAAAVLATRRPRMSRAR